MIGLGFLWRKNGPKQINGIYGYRTARSTSSPEAWNFAHVYSARLYLILGIVLLIPTLISIRHYWSADADTIAVLSIAVLTVQTIVFVLTIPITESALKKHFDKNGNRKEKQMPQTQENN
ncbi:SdpI family protein [Methanimicrococcus hacksteinii]|nr:SdpI family protein [Methanimicrococcus sp. At1]